MNNETQKPSVNVTRPIKSVPNLDNEEELLRAIEEFKDNQEVMSVVNELEGYFSEIKDIMHEMETATEEIKKLEREMSSN